MRLARNLRLSVRAFSTQRTRVLLGVSATAIGIAGVLVLTAIGQAARNQVTRRIESLGHNMLVITARPVESRAGRRLGGTPRTRTLRTVDAAAIVRASSAVIRVAPAQDGDLIARYGTITNPATVIGTTPEWPVIRQFPLERGRFFDSSDDLLRRRVAVLGAAARTNLFPDSIDPIGRTIRIGRVPFEVVGVLASKGISADGNATEDDRIIVPLETALHRLFRQEYIKTIYLEAASASLLADAERDAAAILRARHELSPRERDDFDIQNQRVVMAAELAARTSFQRSIMGLGFLSLLIGGVGILSVMLLSIRERRAEIGLRVALGARATDIVTQFLAEATMLAGLGGVVGVALGVALLSLVAATTQWDTELSSSALVIAGASAFLIGIGCGVFPAWKAATLDPVEALRTE
jgi:putative ABC transport system permease protein